MLQLRARDDEALKWTIENGHIECANYIKAAIEEIE